MGLAGRYVLDRILGSGASADVYGGRDRVLARPVAVKWLRGDAAPEVLARWHSEASLLAGLDHPGLVRLFDSGTEDGRPFLVMERVGPHTLRSVLTSGPMALRAVAEIGRQLAGALAYLHDRGLVHRDVSPANVLVSGGPDEPGQVWLADLGIARSLDAAHLTATGTTLGTPAFLSPEQVRGEAVTSASDIWSLGLVLLECVTGHREYEGPAAECAVARLSRPPQIPAALPPGWARLLGEMLAPDPRLRPAAAVVAADLAALLAAGVVDAEAAVPRTATGSVATLATGEAGETGERWPWYRWFESIRWVHVQAALVVATVAVAILGWSLLRADRGGVAQVAPAVHSSSTAPASTSSRPTSAAAPATVQAVARTAGSARPGSAPASSRGHGPGKAHGHGHGHGHSGGAGAA